MGTVLHPAFVSEETFYFRVSVPFSMGTVLHPDWFKCGFSCVTSFSPLLDGDGVASMRSLTWINIKRPFQSPSRWGRCCIAPRR